MDDLPELPFEKVLSYLSLEDRLNARAVSRRWYHTINRFKVKTLCYSERPSGFIYRKGRWVSGAFAQNFISSTRFSSFFNTFSPTILSNLKRLRICDLHLNAEENGTFTFIPALNLFGHLEELDIINFINFTHPSAASDLGEEVELNLPMLTSIHLEEVKGIDQLTLDAPKLKRVKLLLCSSSLKLKLVHADSVEWLATGSLEHLAAKSLKSLKYLHCRLSSRIDDSTFLSGLEQLKEVHVLRSFIELFQQKQRYGRTDLKIFGFGLLLNGPDDPAISSFRSFNSRFDHLIKNPSRLADEIPLLFSLPYTALDGFTPESVINVLSRFTDLKRIKTDSSIPSQDVQRFLDLLKKLPNIVNLLFFGGQPQDLFDRLPEHSAIQCLGIDHPVLDFRFLFRLEHLIAFKYSDQIPAEVVRKAFEELQFLQLLQFQHHNKQVQIVRTILNRWMVSINEEESDVADLNAAIKLIFGRTQTKKKTKKRNKRR